MALTVLKVSDESSLALLEPPKSPFFATYPLSSLELKLVLLENHPVTRASKTRACISCRSPEIQIRRVKSIQDCKGGTC